MRSEDVLIEDEGKRVTVRLQARSLLPAHKAHRYADENPPIGYILLRASIARRKRGGKVRYVRLNYLYTGKSPEPPMATWEEWDATLQAEQQIASHRGEEDGNQTTDRDLHGQQG